MFDYLVFLVQSQNSQCHCECVKPLIGKMFIISAENVMFSFNAEIQNSVVIGEHSFSLPVNGMIGKLSMQGILVTTETKTRLWAVKTLPFEMYSLKIEYNGDRRPFINAVEQQVSKKVGRLLWEFYADRFYELLSPRLDIATN